MGRNARRVLVVVVLASAGALGVGCGGGSGSEGEDSTVDIPRVEGQLKKILTRPAGPASPSPIPGQPAVPATAGIDVKSVDCPEDVESTKGNKFKCTVDAGQATGSVDVTQTDDDGKLFDFNAKLKEPALTITTKGKLDLNVSTG